MQLTSKSAESHAMLWSSRFLAIVFTTAWCLQSIPAQAVDLTGTQTTQIISITGERTKTDTTILIEVNRAPAGCEAGFWFTSSETTFTSDLTIVRTALGAKALFQVSGDRDQRWLGSTDHYCRVVLIRTN